MAATDEPVIDQVRQALERSRGSWAQVSLMRNKTFRIAERPMVGRFSANAGRRQGPGMLSSGVPYHTITKIAQRRVTNPRVGTCQRLLDYFRSVALPEALPRTPRA